MSRDPSIGGGASRLSLIDTALEWMARETARGPAVRHLVHENGGSVCNALRDGRVLEADEVAEYRACRACMRRGILHAVFAPIDYSEIEPAFPVNSHAAWHEATQHLFELSAWCDFDGTAAHLQGMADELAGLMADHHAAEWKAWATLETVEHPFGDLEGDRA